MINIINGLQGAITFIADLISQGITAIGNFFDMFGKLADLLPTLGGTLPDFVSPLWLFVFSFCCVALIIKLVPFIG